MGKRSYSSEDRQRALDVLEEMGGNLSAAAEATGVPRKTISTWRDGAQHDDDGDEGETAVALMDPPTDSASLPMDSPPAEVHHHDDDSPPAEVPAGPSLRWEPLDIPPMQHAASLQYTAGGAVLSVAMRQAGQANVALLGQDHACDLLRAGLLSALSDSPATRRYLDTRRRVAEIEATAKEMDDRATRAAASIGTRERGIDLSDSDEVIELYRDELQLRRLREQQREAEELLAEQRQALTVARIWAVSSGIAAAHGVRGAVLSQLISDRAVLSAEAIARITHLLDDLAVTLAAIQHFPAVTREVVEEVLESLPAPPPPDVTATEGGQ